MNYLRVKGQAVLFMVFLEELDKKGVGRKMRKGWKRTRVSRMADKCSTVRHYS